MPLESRKDTILSTCEVKAVIRNKKVLFQTRKGIGNSTCYNKKILAVEVDKESFHRWEKNRRGMAKDNKEFLSSVLGRPSKGDQGIIDTIMNMRTFQ